MANQNMNQKPQQGQKNQQNQNWNQKQQTGKTGEKSTVQPADRQPKKETDTSMEE